MAAVMGQQKPGKKEEEEKQRNNKGEEETLAASIKTTTATIVSAGRATAPLGSQRPVVVSLVLVAGVICSFLAAAESAPIVNLLGPQLDDGPAAWQPHAYGSRQKHVLRPFVAHLREPMPWEDGYFDPTYHAWPKGGKSGGDSKQSSSSAAVKRSLDSEQRVRTVERRRA